jgi:hypothetical protein
LAIGFWEEKDQKRKKTMAEKVSRKRYKRKLRTEEEKPDRSRNE